MVYRNCTMKVDIKQHMLFKKERYYEKKKSIVRFYEIFTIDLCYHYSLSAIQGFSKTSFLKVRATPAATFVAKKATEIAAIVPSKAIPNIFKPVFKI